MSNKMRASPQSCILFFVKNPAKGEVKSRLAAQVGETIAVELYKNFILDMLSTINTSKAQCLICFYPEGAQKKLEDWLGKKYHCLPQEGSNLGERMKHGFLRAFSMKFENAVLIGSDIPDLPLSLLKQAFLMLKNHDAVVGPAHDGGYYLIGFRHDTFIPEVFAPLRWGGTTVLRSTLNRLKKGDAVCTCCPHVMMLIRWLTSWHCCKGTNQGNAPAPGPGPILPDNL